MTYQGKHQGTKRLGRALSQVERKAFCQPAAGFSLIELLVVMVIIGLLAALVAPRFIRQEEKAKLKAARAQVELLGTALDTFRLDVGRYPTSQEGLEALRRQPGGVHAGHRVRQRR